MPLQCSTVHCTCLRSILLCFLNSIEKQSTYKAAGNGCILRGCCVNNIESSANGRLVWLELQPKGSAVNRHLLQGCRVPRLLHTADCFVWQRLSKTWSEICFLGTQQWTQQLLIACIAENLLDLFSTEVRNFICARMLYRANTRSTKKQVRCRVDLD